MTKEKSITFTLLQVIIFLHFFGNTISGSVYDIELLVYPSSNISKNEFDKQKVFVKALTASITTSPNFSDLGVIVYMRDMDRDYRIKRTDHTDISSFNQAVNNIPLMNYKHRTNWALRYAWKKVLNRVNVTPQTPRSYIILITDGFERDNRDSENQQDVSAQMLQDGIKIVAVGIGQKVNFSLLQSFTGDTEFVIFSPELNTIPSLAGLGVSNIDDVVVLVDLAASIIRQGLEDIKLFIKQEASLLGISLPNTKIGVLSYNYDSAHVVNLTSIVDLSTFNQTIDNIPSFEQSGIKEAIHIGKSMFTPKDSGTNVPRNIMVLLTDGLANHDRVSQIKNMTAGIDLLVVGVGPNVNQTDLNLIAGESKTFIAPTFDYLASENFGNQIVKELAVFDKPKAATEPTEEPTSNIKVYVIIGVVALSLLAVVLFIILWKKRRNQISQGKTHGTIHDKSSEQNSLEKILEEIEEAVNFDGLEISPTSITLGKKIGEGAFGTVFAGAVDEKKMKFLKYWKQSSNGFNRKERDFEVAIKKIKDCPREEELEDFREEIEMMKTIGYHKNIVNLIGCSTKREPLCLVVEYMCYGDLLNYLRQRRSKLRLARNDSTWNAPEFMFTENYQQAVQNVYGTQKKSTSQFSTTSNINIDERYMVPSTLKVPSPEQNPENEIDGDLTADDLMSFQWQIACGMEYLASNKIVHRDLAARNVLVGYEKVVKISDFGLTRKMSNGVYTVRNQSRKLPIKWMSVEAIFDQIFTEYSDVWAYGVVLFEIATLGGSPYPEFNNQELLKKLKSGYRMEKPDNCAQPMYDMMLKCWSEDRSKRPTFSDLRQELEDVISNGDSYCTLDVDEESNVYSVPSFHSAPEETDDESSEASKEEIIENANERIDTSTAP